MGAVQDVATFLFRNKHCSDIVGKAFLTRSCEIVPLLRIYYSVDQDSGYSYIAGGALYKVLDRKVTVQLGGEIII